MAKETVVEELSLDPDSDAPTMRGKILQTRIGGRPMYVVRFSYYYSGAEGAGVWFHQPQVPTLELARGAFNAYAKCATTLDITLNDRY